MKKRKLLTTLLIIGFIYPFCLLGQTNKSKSGFYETINDYYTGNLKYVGEYDDLSYKYIAFKENGVKTKYKFKEITHWGFSDNNGLDYRRALERNMAIINPGAITIYSLLAYVYQEGENTRISYDLRTVWISKGLEGEPMLLNNFKTIKQLKAWFREGDKELADKFDKESLITFPSSSQKMVDYINTYNERRLVESKEGIKKTN